MKTDSVSPRFPFEKAIEIKPVFAVVANSFNMNSVETFFLNKYNQHSVKVRKLLSAVAHTGKETNSFSNSVV